MIAIVSYLPGGNQGLSPIQGVTAPEILDNFGLIQQADHCLLPDRQHDWEEFSSLSKVLSASLDFSSLNIHRLAMEEHPSWLYEGSKRFQQVVQMRKRTMHWVEHFSPHSLISQRY